MNLSATHFPELLNAQGKRFSTTWEKLVARLSVPIVAQYKNEVPGLSLATFAGDRRSLANVEQVFALGFDLDEAVSWPDVRDRFKGSASFVHSTWSSTLCEPRARVFLLLSRPVTGDEYRLAFAAVAKHIEDRGLVVDRAASDPSRFWFLPCVQPHSSFHHFVGSGAPLNADGAIAAAPAPPVRPPRSPLPVEVRADAYEWGRRTAFDRARAYLAKTDPAIQGSGGRTHTFVTAQRLVRGFALSVDEAFDLMLEWNQRCQPPWSDRDLRVKCEEAAKSGRFNEGDMLERSSR